MTEPPKVINHKAAVRYVHSLLEENIRGLEEVYSGDDEGNRLIDLTSNARPLSSNGSSIYEIDTAIIVFDHFTFNKNGKIRNYTKDKLGASCYSLICTGARRKILVITDFQLFHQWKQYVKQKNKVDAGKRGDVPAGNLTKESRKPSNFFIDGVGTDQEIRVILIDFPVFRNTGWSKSSNKTLTFSQILAELKFGLLNAIDIVAPVGKSIIEGVEDRDFRNENQVSRTINYLLTRRGYGRKKQPEPELKA